MKKTILIGLMIILINSVFVFAQPSVTQVGGVTVHVANHITRLTETTVVGALELRTSDAERALATRVLDGRSCLFGCTIAGVSNTDAIALARVMTNLGRTDVTFSYQLSTTSGSQTTTTSITESAADLTATATAADSVYNAKSAESNYGPEVLAPYSPGTNLGPGHEQRLAAASPPQGSSPASMQQGSADPQPSTGASCSTP